MHKKRTLLWIFGGIFFSLLIVLGIFSYKIWCYVYKPNVVIPEGKYFVCIPSNSNFQTLKDSLFSHNFIADTNSFLFIAQQKNITNKIPPGRYKISDGMNNLELIDKIRSGAQDPVNVIFNNINSIHDLAQTISRQIEVDSNELIFYLSDEEFLRPYGVSPATVFVLFIPNTYQFFWNTSAKLFIDRMKLESDKFWNESRMELAQKLDFSREEVVTLASIVEKETSIKSEKPLIAGVYINRLRSNWNLQADPSLKYAAGDPGIKRILNRHKRIDSPYNTYLYAGLPPGPICMPSISSIDAVLKYEPSNYYFFCAKPDLTGHSFSRTLSEHNNFAREYRQAQFSSN